MRAKNALASAGEGAEADAIRLHTFGTSRSLACL